MTRPRGAAQNRRVAEVLRTVAMKFDKAAEWEERDQDRGEYETRWAWEALERCLASEHLAVQLWPVDPNPWPLDRSRPDQPDSVWLHYRGD